jgi:hypothetical protein
MVFQERTSLEKLKDQVGQINLICPSPESSDITEPWFFLLTRHTMVG